MNKFIYFILVSLFFITGMEIIIAEINTDNFHPKDTDCQQCHLARGEITAGNATQLLSTQEKLCARCHESALKVSHPSGFNPGRDIPGDFPLDWKNEITCSTCHNVHTGKHSSIRGGISGKELCLSCHDMSFFRAMADSGLSIQQNAHMGKTTNTLSAIDNYSMECMSCHANQGDTVDISINSRGIVKHASGAVNHPVGMIYANAYNKGGYRAMSEISDNVILPDGKVSCLSCHKAYTKKHGATLNKTTRTSLCFECHDM
ncbi:MAG: cytochrome c3 family protein [Gammaproteobacteria bacterium]|nr:cytochrome c3 family protein [Gammaproteobacteria bacterium]